jgi:hypothetical protein
MTSSGTAIIFKFATGKTVGPVAHDETPSKSVVDAAVI